MSSRRSLDVRVRSLEFGAHVEGTISGVKPGQAAWVDVGLGSDLIVHQLDLKRIDGFPKLLVGTRVRGRVSPALPQEGKVGLIPNYPGRADPFPLGLTVPGRVKNIAHSLVFIDLGSSVDAVLDAKLLSGPPVPDQEIAVQIERVDWETDPKRPKVSVVPSGGKAKSPVARSDTTERRAIVFLLDGSNLRHAFGATPGLSVVHAVRNLLLQQFAEARVLCVYDSSVLDFLDGRAAVELVSAQMRGEAIVTFEGVEADLLVLAMARQLGAIVVSNDRFADHEGERLGLPLVNVTHEDRTPRLGAVTIFEGADAERQITLDEHLRKSPGRVST